MQSPPGRAHLAAGRQTGRMARLALVTCAQLPDLDEDSGLARQALIDAGHDVATHVWDDSSVDWAGHDLVIVRTAWDYTSRRAEFVAWADRVGALTRLANPASVLRWNSDKHYLADLAGVGLPVVPTAFLEPGEDPAAAHPFADVEHVVKPATGAGSVDAHRHQPGQSSVAHITRLLESGRSAVLQPYLSGVDTAGETALIHLGGLLSHAMRKGPLLRPGMADVEGLFLQEEMSPRQASPAELQVAQAVLDALPQVWSEAGVRAELPLLYARIDLLPGPDGPQLLELELTEPSLFFEHVPQALPAWVSAVEAALQRPAPTPHP